MDWKFAHYAQETVLKAEPARVMEATRAFLAEALASWRISDTGAGLEAKGRSAGHASTAMFRVEPTSGGSKLAVNLQVERAATTGYMLVDIGGFYDGQIRRWLEGIQIFLHHGPATAKQPEALEQRKKAVAKSQRGERFFIICAVAFLVILICAYTIAAIVGLLTGSLYIPGRGSGDVTIHGTWARILSAAMLLLFGWIALRIWKPKNRNRGSGWLPPS